MVLLPVTLLSTSATCTVTDAVNPGVLDIYDTPVTTLHHIYVDNNNSLDITVKACFEHDTAAGIEAIFILLGKSNLTWCLDPISWDKLLDMIVAPVNHVLDLTINTCWLTVGVLPAFLAEVITLLQTMLGPHQQSFLISKAEVLTGKLNHIGFGTPWLKFLLRYFWDLVTLHCIICLYLVRLVACT